MNQVCRKGEESIAFVTLNLYSRRDAAMDRVTLKPLLSLF